MKKLVLLVVTVTLAACGRAEGPAGIHAGDEVRWQEPGSAGSKEPVTRTATVADWDGAWIECTDGKRLEGSTFEFQVVCPHE